MAKVTDLTQALNKYKGGSTDKTSFFSLENDKDSAVVRFLHGSELVAERDWFIVHQVDVNGKKRWVQCLEESNCPLCLSGNRPQLRLFLQIVDSRDGQLKVWERGQTFVQKIVGLMAKYGSLYERPFEVQRFGKKGDTKTTYEIYPLDKDGKTRLDFPESIDLKGGLIMSKTVDEMRALLAGDVEPDIRPRGNSGRPTDTF
jgi:hypothetical protein